MGGPSSDTRNDIYRVDRDRVHHLFLAGTALAPRPRTRYDLSHDVVLDGSKVILRMYGCHDVAVRDTRTGVITFSICGWPTIETKKVIEPLIHHYFGNIWSTRYRGAGRGKNRGREGELWILWTGQVQPLLAGHPGKLQLDNWVTFKPLGGTVWEVTDGHDTLRFDMRGCAP